jgi:hypothetical protein
MKLFIKACFRKILKPVGVWAFLSRFRGTCRKARRVYACRQRYARVLHRIRRKPKDERVKVLFIVCEIAKFKCQTLFEAMRRDGRFEPIIVLSAWNVQALHTDEELDMEFAEAERFFDRLGFNHVRTVLTHPRRFIPLDKFEPDVVFFSEQWAPRGRQDPESVSKFALMCYVPYFVPNYGDIDTDCHNPTQEFSWRYYALDRRWAALYRAACSRWTTVMEFIPAGHPGLDYAFHARGRLSQGDKVIYAPHFSFPIEGRPWKLTWKWGTFNWNGREILAYAEKHPEQHWVFKPHPLLRESLVETGLMTKDESDEYYARWERLGEVCYDSDYKGLFLVSRAMITDGGTFLTEYGATGKPIIHLICPDNVLKPLPPSKIVYDTYYDVHDLDEMYSIFKMVLEEGRDPARDRRLAGIKKAGWGAVDAAANIVTDLAMVLRR